MSHEPVEIRAATAADLAQVMLCARAAYSRYLQRMNREPAPMNADFASQIEQGQVYLAFRRSLFAGYVVFYQERDHIHLENVAVLPTFSGQGIGRALIKYAEDAARQAGLRAIELYTNEVMTENLAMYPKLGYVETERKQQAGFNRVFFRKSL